MSNYNYWMLINWCCIHDLILILTWIKMAWHHLAWKTPVMLSCFGCVLPAMIIAMTAIILLSYLVLSLWRLLSWVRLLVSWLSWAHGFLLDNCYHGHCYDWLMQMILWPKSHYCSLYILMKTATAVNLSFSITSVVATTAIVTTATIDLSLLFHFITL